MLSIAIRNQSTGSAQPFGATRESTSAAPTLDSGLLRAGELLIPIAGCMGREMIAGSYIQELLSRCRRTTSVERTTRVSLAVGSLHGGTVVFDFKMSRAGAWPKEFLANFKGILQPDGYAGYDDIRNPGVIHAL